jgi:hypothetical protein
MKGIFKRSFEYFGGLNVVSCQEWLSAFDFPLPRIIAAASFGCLASWTIIYGLAPHVVESPRDLWVGLLVDGAVPVLVAFLILYRSNWHEERAPAARMGQLLGLSCAILGGLLALIGTAFTAFCFIWMNILTGTLHP